MNRETSLHAVLVAIEALPTPPAAPDDLWSARWLRALQGVQAADAAMQEAWGDPWALPEAALQTCLGQLRQVLAAWDAAEAPEAMEEVYEAWALQREDWEDALDDVMDALDDLN